eukprot:12763522-Ditylum_brightwellii.AAC.1
MRGGVTGIGQNDWDGGTICKTGTGDTGGGAIGIGQTGLIGGETGDVGTGGGNGVQVLLKDVAIYE